MSIKYEEYLWNNVDFLHNRHLRQNSYISNLLDIITRFQIACQDFSKHCQSIINKNYLLVDADSTTLIKSMEAFIKTFMSFTQIFNQASESMKTNLLTPMSKSVTDTFIKEKEIYGSYCKVRSVYNAAKSSLEKAHNEFNSKAKECETLVYNARRAKIHKGEGGEQLLKLEDMAAESLTNTVLFEDKYIHAIEEANKEREVEAISQKKIHKFYEINDKDYYDRVKSATGFYITTLKQMNAAIAIEIDSIRDKYSRIKMDEDIKSFIKSCKTVSKPEAPIEFVPYNVAPEIVNSSINNPKLKGSKDLEVSLEVISTFQKVFRDIRKDLNMGDERKKSNVRIIINKMFNLENPKEFGKKEKEELVTYLKEQNLRKYFIKFLSKLKTKGFKNSIKLFKDLKEIFITILEISEKEKDYDSAQNCIVLSQTFFNEKTKQKKKKFLIDYIRSYKWLNTVEFWEKLMEWLIEQEITKSEELNKNKSEKEKKSNIQNIAFPQIFSYSNNMVEFNIEKKDIINLVEKLCEKYEIEKVMVNSIIDNVNSIEKKDTGKEDDEDEEEEIKHIKKEEPKKETKVPEVKKDDTKKNDEKKVETKNEIKIKEDYIKDDEKEDKKKEENENSKKEDDVKKEEQEKVEEKIEEKNMDDEKKEEGKKEEEKKEEEKKEEVKKDEENKEEENKEEENKEEENKDEDDDENDEEKKKEKEEDGDDN